MTVAGICRDCGQDTGVEKVRLQVVLKSPSKTRVIVAPDRESSADETTAITECGTASNAHNTIHASSDGLLDHDNATLL